MKYITLLLLILLLIACGQKKSTDGGLELTDTQLKEIIKKQPQINNPGTGDAAMQQLEMSYQSDSSNLDNVYNLAFMYCNKCVADTSFVACPKAEQYLSRVIRLKADYRQGKAYYNRALCFEHQSKLDAALQDLNRFSELNANNSKPPVNYFMKKAMLLKKMDRNREACAELKRAEKHDTTGISQIEWRADCMPEAKNQKK
jgi:tetratricopeptide (TPR) repeat protein